MSGMSGSEIKEACREAAMVPVREMIRTQREKGHSVNQLRVGEVRGVRTEDFFMKAGGIQQIQQSIKDQDVTGKDQGWSTASSSLQGDSDMEVDRDTIHTSSRLRS